MIVPTMSSAFNVTNKPYPLILCNFHCRTDYIIILNSATKLKMPRTSVPLGTYSTRLFSNVFLITYTFDSR